MSTSSTEHIPDWGFDSAEKERTLVREGKGKWALPIRAAVLSLLIQMGAGEPGISKGQDYSPAASLASEIERGKEAEELHRALTEKYAQLKELFGDEHWSVGWLKKWVDYFETAGPEEALAHYESVFKPKLEMDEERETATEDLYATVYSAEGTRTIALQKESINKIFRETLPGGWAFEAGELIFDENDEGVMPASYGVSSRAMAFSEEPTEEYPQGRIRFTKASIRKGVRSVVGFLLHEVCHKVDWVQGSVGMDVVERVDLLYSVAKRVKSENRFRSRYVEAISNDNPRVELANKTAEYFPEICAQYFIDYTKLHIEDYQLVQRHVRRYDLGFDVASAGRKREEIVVDILAQNELAPEELQL